MMMMKNWAFFLEALELRNERILGFLIFSFFLASNYAQRVSE